MKTLEEYLAIPYRMEVARDVAAGDCVALFPDLAGCVAHGETPLSAVSNALAAKKDWIMSAVAEGTEIPEVDVQRDYTDQLSLTVPADLYKSIVERAQELDISVEQFCVYMLRIALRSGIFN